MSSNDLNGQESDEDNISLSSSVIDGTASENNVSYAAVPLPYTTEQAVDNEKLQRRKTREEEIQDDEEYLQPGFKQEDAREDLSMDQNINLYLLNEGQDMVGGRHLSVGLDERPNLEDIDDEEEEEEEAAADEEKPKLTRRRSSAVESLRRTSTFQSIKKFHLWDDDFKRDRIKAASGFLLNHVALGLGFMVVLSIYWGSMYHRNLRYKNLKMLVVTEDQQYNSMPPLIGEAVDYVANMPAVKAYGGWQVFNHTSFRALADKHNNTVEEEVYRQIHHRNYWAAILVQRNATQVLYEMLTNQNTTAVGTTKLIDAVYGSGRDPIAMTSYVTTFVGVFESAFLKVASSSVYPKILSSLTVAQVSSVSLTALTDPISFNRIDIAPITNPVIFAPLQLGLVYIVVFAFFQFLLSIKVQAYVASRVKGAKYILFRIVTSQVAYFVLSLAYSTLNASFGLSYSAAFGKSGFLVMWATGYLTIASLGGLNENMALLCFAYFPPLIGLWLLFLMVSNIAPTFSPLALCPTFYRYGYALPIHNSYELFKVIFFDGYKGQIGRSFGILVAWIVVTNAFLPLTLKHVAKVNKRKEEKAAAKAKKEGDN